ncbi:MAG: VOC family protein [Alphaproteobacteria bacterium]|nr:VOC family protein [Alphaproteobacteria bacterium]
MAVQPLGIDHLVLRVADLPRTLAFYCGALGCTLERSREDLGLYHLRAGRALIDVVTLDGPLGRAGGRAAGSEARNLDHFCLRIEPFDEATLRAHLARHGIELGKIERRFGAEGQGRSAYLRDPDGNVVELKGPRENGAA